MSMGIRIFAWVVHIRLLLLTRGSVRWMILMTERERLRLRGTAWNMAVGGRKEKVIKRKEASKKKRLQSTSDNSIFPEETKRIQWQCQLDHRRIVPDDLP